MSETPKPQRRKWSSFTAVYAHILRDLQCIARKHGYALAAHGSMAHDLDLIAVPWIEDAAEPFALIEALRASINGFMEPSVPGSCNPCYKPHGRRCWTIYFRETEIGWGPYLDISVLPRLAEAGVESLLPFPEFDEARICVACGLQKQWGKFDPTTGVSVCRDCMAKVKA